ncbi:hypothetical protein J2X90_005588 [Variovorax paradoxus]|nr:hypothetical protein [Variovorax paradoxus]
MISVAAWCYISTTYRTAMGMFFSSVSEVSA